MIRRERRHWIRTKIEYRVYPFPGPIPSAAPLVPHATTSYDMNIGQVNTETLYGFHIWTNNTKIHLLRFQGQQALQMSHCKMK